MELFEHIQVGKDYKNSLLDQLSLMDEQRKIFQEKIKKMKQERAALQREIYRCRNIYDRSLLQHNKDIFMQFIRDPRLRKEYFTATRALWQKRRTRQDSSEELNLLRNLDEKARAIRASFSLSSDLNIERTTGSQKRRI